MVIIIRLIDVSNFFRISFASTTASRVQFFEEKGVSNRNCGRGKDKQPAPAPACLVLASGIGDGNFVSFSLENQAGPSKKNRSYPGSS